MTGLPRWVEVGAFILALVAGAVNAVGLLSFEHQSVSHVSGTATQLGAYGWRLPLRDSVHLLGVLLSFLLGAIIAGALLRGTSLKLGRHYDTALLLESALLIAALACLLAGQFSGHFFASAACGLQNALVTTYSGAVIRTTHLTGIFTDLGIMLGQRLRGETVDVRKLRLFLLIIGGFVLGALAGALLFHRFALYALVAPAAICLMLGLAYRLYSKSIM